MYGQNIKKIQRRERLIQMIPGLMLWGTILIIFILSFTEPTIVIYLVILYITYFVYQSLTMMVLVFMANKRISQVYKINWIEKLDKEYPRWKDIYNVLLIPVANEGEEILIPTIEACKKINYPKDKKIILIATEKKFPNGEMIAKKLQKIYKNDFYKFIITVHELKDGEIAGKASNENFAAREFYKQNLKFAIPIENILITSNDADYRHEPNYFAYLTYTFLKTDKRYSAIFQPIPIFYNNIWKVPIVSRIIATFAAQWQMAVTFKPERFINFSCYAINLRSLNEVGYWDTNIIPEDERLFWKTTIKYGDDAKVIPLYIPVFGDAVLGDTYWKSIKEQYKQLRRWAWGASEMTFSIPNVIQHKELSRYKKFYLLFQQLRNSFERSLAPIIITFGDLIPELNSHYQKLSLSYTMPSLISRIMTVSTLLVVIILFFEAKLAPKRGKEKILKNAFSYVGWVTYPLVSIIFSSIPAIDAQTRLLLGKNIQYIPTAKKSVNV